MKIYPASLEVSVINTSISLAETRIKLYFYANETNNKCIDYTYRNIIHPKVKYILEIIKKNNSINFLDPIITNGRTKSKNAQTQTQNIQETPLLQLSKQTTQPNTNTPLATSFLVHKTINQ